PRFQGNKPFILRHSMLPARVDRDGALRILERWMDGGVMQPDDLRKASRVTSLDRTYLPFYVSAGDPTTECVRAVPSTRTSERRRVRRGHPRRDPSAERRIRRIRERGGPRPVPPVKSSVFGRLDVLVVGQVCPAVRAHLGLGVDLPSAFGTSGHGARASYGRPRYKTSRRLRNPRTSSG